MRKLLSSLLFATVAGALVVGAAASLNVTSTNIGSGFTEVTSCDGDGINVAYTFIANEPQLVDGVSIEGIADTCSGQTITLVVSDGDSAVIAEATGTLDGQAIQAFALTFPGEGADSIDAASIGEVAVTITGGSAAVDLAPLPVAEEEVVADEEVVAEEEVVDEGDAADEGEDAEATAEDANL